ncbi:C2 and Extensin domain protein [Aspergillus bombycis]|uniref:C2 and Extensin domain protein n=1 Tax=Aspergillus bombycis TaxID=109264 RepID=A0A1F7ZMF5_9EURO|nr:C2 and Extensin domain protein [Aspergillus bombycis]OGM40601.1 C2 and Extensin domain protein [Aspergillus bombycis]
MASKPPRLSMINHAAGIYADMSVDGPAIGTLVLVVDRAKNLPNRKTMGKQNPYCAARLGKEAKKTDTDLRGGQTPRWDQELRFTVHESPDYFRLKVTIFNDDKRTDLIGETWIDLKDLIIPGGSQSDHWHPLQFRGKYAGEVRIEMTYYDTRPEDEAVIERRTQAVEKVNVHGKPSASSSSLSSRSSPAPISSSSSLSGPRQLKEVKRRPLPSGPPGSAPARPALPEKIASAPPVPAQSPPRPTPEHTHSTPPLPTHDYSHSSPSPVEYTRHSSRHSGPSEVPFDAVAHGPPPGTASHPGRAYETPDDLHRDWSNPPHQAPPPPRRHPQEVSYHSYRERPDPYDTRSHARPRSGYGNAPPPDFRTSRHDRPTSRSGPEMYAPMSEATPPRPSSHHSNHYAFASPEQYVPNEIAQVQQVSRYRQRSPASIREPQVEYGSHPVETEPRYRPHSNSLLKDTSPIRPPSSRESLPAEYATMQPRVEDEEEEGPPPPPPVHRSGLVQTSQQLVPSPTPSYQAYSPEFATPRTSQEINMSQPSHMQSDGGRMQDLPPHTNGPSVPPSLVAGFDPAIAEAEADRAEHERRQSRRRSELIEEIIMPPEPTSMIVPYPVEPSPPIMDDRRSLISRGSAHSSETRLVPRRKSVSPRPPPLGDREASQIPFSPDSFDAFNPNAARAAVLRDPAPAYETPAEAMDAARRSEREAARDPGPIIGDDGREIDPSDHLPTDTWAPEPERKTKKAGWWSVSRMSHERGARRHRLFGSLHHGPGPWWTEDIDVPNHTWRILLHGRTMSSPNAAPSHRASVSPSPRGHSPSSLYAPVNAGPPIPAKVPIAQPMNQNYPVMGGTPQGYPVTGGNQGMDALSRELNTIDIGSVGYNNQRALRRYVPRLPAGYAA